MFLACRFPGDLRLRSKHININVVNSPKFALTTFLLTESDIRCTVIIRRTTYGVILRYDVLKLLCWGLVQYSGSTIAVSGVYLFIQEELAGFCVWAGPTCEDIAKVLWNTVRSRKNVRVKRISVEIRDLQESLV